MWNSTLNVSEGPHGLALDSLCQPRIEPEAVFGLKAAPRDGAGLDELFEALAWVAPGFEIVQSHLPDWKFTAAQTVADGGLHRRLLVGRKVPIPDLAADAEELHEALAGARVALRRDGALVEQGCGAFVLGSPLQALLHFLTEIRACPGAPELAAGDLVTTGTWADAWPVHPGQTWVAAFDSALPALQVTLR